MAEIRDKNEKGSPAVSSLYSSDFIRKTRRVWGEVYGKVLTADEACSIISAMHEFATFLRSVVDGGDNEEHDDSYVRARE